MHKRKLAFLLALLLTLALASVALAAPNAFSPSLSWWTVDNGGGTSANGAYSLTGTIGQPDAGPVMTNSSYSLSGGYWGISGAASSPNIYLPLLSRR